MIELLLVIAILAILATVTVVVLNPAEILRQSRDAARVSEVKATSKAISFFLSTNTVGSSLLGTCPANGRCTSGAGCGAVSTSTAVNGTGWVDVNFTLVPGGSPLAALPIDPINNGILRYGYVCTSATSTYFEVNANMESIRYANGGQGDVENTDGGNDANCFEDGNLLTLVFPAC